MQVLTFYETPTNTWHAIVYPADCTLASASASQIHLHGRAAWSEYQAVDAVLDKIRNRIYKCFLLGGANEAPIFLEQEAPCNCHQRTISVVGQGSVGPDAEIVSPSVENKSTHGADPTRASDAPNISTGSSSLGTQQPAAQEILSVIQNIQSTLEAIEQRMHHCPVYTSSPLSSGGDVDIRAGQPNPTIHSPVQAVTPPADRTISGGLSVLSGDSPLDDQPRRPVVSLRPQSGASTLASHFDADIIFNEDLTFDARLAIRALEIGLFGTSTFSPDEADEHTRRLIREEISRVLAGAMSSLTELVRSGDGE